MLCPDRHYGDSSDASHALRSISVKSLYCFFFNKNIIKNINNINNVIWVFF